MRKRYWFGLLSLALILTAAATVYAIPSARSEAGKALSGSVNTAEYTLDIKHTALQSHTETVPYETLDQDDPSLNKGVTQVSRLGLNGERTIDEEVTYRGDKEVGRRQISSTFSQQPEDEIVLHGTYVKPTPRYVPLPLPLFTYTPPPVVPSFPGYYNSSGIYTPSPSYTPVSGYSATALCNDGTTSYSMSRSGTCSSHGGVSVWY